MCNKTKAVYAGMFDPLTLGHCSIIERAAKLPFDEIVVAVTQNADKRERFSGEERLLMLRETLEWIGVSEKVSGELFSDAFLVNYCKEIGATHIIRGLRNISDFEYESGVIETNEDIDPNIEHILLPCAKGYQRVSSTSVMALIGHCGWENVVKKYVPNPVHKKLVAKYRS